MKASRGDNRNVCVSTFSTHGPRTSDVFTPETMADEHTPTPPPSRWASLIMVPTLVEVELVWRGRLCDVVLVPSCLGEHTLSVVSNYE